MNRGEKSKMNTITYTVNGQVQYFDAQTIQEANQKIAEVERRYNVPGNEFHWTHPIEEQIKDLIDAPQLLCEDNFIEKGND